MGKLHKELKNCKHPNSRKTKALAKKAKHVNNKQKLRLKHAISSNIIGEKLMWFHERIERRKLPITPDEFIELILEYLRRFDNELEQIEMKQSISKNRSKQHVARQSVIKFTLERERSEFNGGGLELLNLCDLNQCKALLNWDGNSVNVQHFKLDLISRNFLEKLKESEKMKSIKQINDSPKIIITSYCDDNNE